MDPPREDATMNPHHKHDNATNEDITNSDRPSTAPGRMLSDLIRNCQVLSGELPPDGWDDDGKASPPRIERKQSGTLSLSAPDTFARRIVSAPAPSSPWSKPSKGKSARPRYYSMNHFSQTSASEAAMPLTPVQVPRKIQAPSSESLVPERPRSKDEARYRSTQDGPYPSMAPPRSPVTPSSSSIHPALRGQNPPRTPSARLDIPRTRGQMRRDASEDLLLPRGCTFTHFNGVHLPSPLRNVSLPGDDFEDIELIPRGSPRQTYQHPGPAGEKKNWFRKWFSCGRSRK